MRRCRRRRKSIARSARPTSTTSSARPKCSCSRSPTASRSSLESAIRGFRRSPRLLRRWDTCSDNPRGAASATIEALVQAVKQLQADWSIKADGIIGATTLDAINLGPAGLARQAAINMERLRWLERDPPKTRIDVNTAAAFLRILARRAAGRSPQRRRRRARQADAAAAGSVQARRCQSEVARPGLDRCEGDSRPRAPAGSRKTISRLRTAASSSSRAKRIRWAS